LLALGNDIFYGLKWGFKSSGFFFYTFMVRPFWSAGCSTVLNDNSGVKLEMWLDCGTPKGFTLDLL